MSNLINFFAEGFILAGALVLAIAIYPISLLYTRLPTGKIRNAWFFLGVLIVAFIGGYIAYWLQHQGQLVHVDALSVPVIFFFGAVFVLLVNTLSVKTARDIRQIYTLQQENITDPLMGIFNRRYLDKRISDEVWRSKKYRQPLSIFIVDIDHFKQVNDTYGHPIGDEVLKRFAQLVKNSLRESDIVARYGGEELIVILPRTKSERGAQLAERLRLSIAEHLMEIASQCGEKSHEMQLTASIGVAGLTRNIVDHTCLIERADQALYQAKQQGRNLVVHHQEQQSQQV